jgi:hypothetical protein
VMTPYTGQQAPQPRLHLARPPARTR